MYRIRQRKYIYGTICKLEEFKPDVNLLLNIILTRLFVPKQLLYFVLFIYVSCDLCISHNFDKCTHHDRLKTVRQSYFMTVLFLILLKESFKVYKYKCLNMTYNYTYVRNISRLHVFTNVLER